MSAPTRVDFHVKVLDEQVVQRAKAKGLDAIVYAPHFERLPTIRRRAERFSDETLTVIPGREIFTGSWRARKHLLAIGLTDPIPDFITLEGAFEELQRQDAAVLVPHPTFLNVSLGPGDVRTHRDAIDAIEIHNPKHLPWHDTRATRLAAESGIPEYASSYAHLRSTVSEAWTEFHGVEATTDGIVEALKTGAPRAIERRRGPRNVLQRTIEFAHLGWENSWGKIDRIVLPGEEPTHPHNPTYDGRFDDVAVY